MSTVYIVNGDGMGRGDGALGRKLLGKCFRKLADREDTEAIVFYNAGVKMLAEDSPVAVEVGVLRDRGIDLLACRTCVEHFELRGKLLIDRLSDMTEIFTVIGTADKSVTL